MKVSFSERSGPNTTDDDGPVANRVNDLPSPEDELAPATIAQLVQNRARLRMRQENLRPVENAETDGSGRLRIATGKVSDNRLNVCRSPLSPAQRVTHS